MITEAEPQILEAANVRFSDNIVSKTLNTVLTIFAASQISFGRAIAARAGSTTRETQSNSSSSVKKYYKNIKVQADQLTDAVLKGDYKRAADLTYPRLVELMGGRAKFIAALKQGMKEIQSDGYKIISNTSDEPREVIEVKNQLYAIVPTTMQIKVPEGILVGKAFMIGVSKDGGETWTFVDSGGRDFDKRQLKTLFPVAAEKLRIPEIKQPVLYSLPKQP